MDRRCGERRHRSRTSPDRRAVENALGRIGQLRGRIKDFVGRHGEPSGQYFERAVREWYGPLEDRVALLEACRGDRALEEAWRIVHDAGFQAAPLVPYVVRHYYGEPVIDQRA